MLFVLLYVIVILFILLLIVRWIVGLGGTFAVLLDMLVLGGFAIYYAHHEWFVHIASGKAVYFWDALLFVLVSFIYAITVTQVTNGFPRIAGVFHYIVAWMTTGIIYGVINYEIYDGLGPLLNNEQMNTVVHLAIISVLAVFIFNKRMRIFQ